MRSDFKMVARFGSAASVAKDRLTQLGIRLMVLQRFLQLLRVAVWATATSLALAATPPASATADPAPPHHSQRLLRELDRFLDHHPLLEDDLRIEPALVVNQDYLRKNPELQRFLAANPEVPQALQAVPRHFLHRALMREANTPLQFADLAQLDPLLSAQPAIERQLIENPEYIRNQEYVHHHPELDSFLAQHASLNREFLPPCANKL